MDSEIFTIPARRCKRCGGLLTSEQAMKDGYGACCLRKIKQEQRAKEALKDQISLFEEPREEKRGDGTCATGLSPYGNCGSAIYCGEPYDCCAACHMDCNIRCGWAPDPRKEK